MLDAEAALARAEADCGIVPSTASEQITSVCFSDRFDLEQLGREARRSGNPIVPLVPALRAMVPPDAQMWVHWGATSQDILDTASMLVTRRILNIIEADLKILATACSSLAQTHRTTVMVGRTMLQHALPITFGLKAAGWLSGLDSAQRELSHAASTLAVQLGGAVGTLASLGTVGPDVVAAFARHLHLAEPVLPWHTARQRIAIVAAALGIVVGSVAKISTDVALLMQTEIGEAAEPLPGGSSTLPHKRNPVAASAVLAAAKRSMALIPVLFGSMLAEHERAIGAWHAEWQTLNELLALAGGAVARTTDTVRAIDVHPEVMAANLERLGGALLSERVELTLADKLGNRDEAHGVVANALNSPLPMAEALAIEPGMDSVLEHTSIEDLLDPTGYLGATSVWIDRVLAAHAKKAS